MLKYVHVLYNLVLELFQVISQLSDTKSNYKYVLCECKYTCNCVTKIGRLMTGVETFHA